MKYIIFLFFTITCALAYGQSAQQAIGTINNEKEAEKYRNEHKSNAEINYMIAFQDTAAEMKELFKLKEGDTLTINEWTYKILSSIDTKFFRARYIYLNGNKLSKKKIDKTRKMLLEKYKEGTPFPDLANKYTMDGNPNGGDLGWFASGWMVKDFEKAVESHKKNDIFTIDVPSNKWYYVTLKTEDDRYSQLLRVIRIKNGS